MIAATQISPQFEEACAASVLDPGNAELRGPRERLEDAVGRDLAHRLVAALSAAGATRRRL
jgi:hypothetical protein